VVVKKSASNRTSLQPRDFGTTMTKKTRPYRELRAERLANPEVAAAYLNATRENSPENLLDALKNVAHARKMATVAKDAGVQRETLYRSLSEQGNPTWDTLTAILAAVGLDVIFKPLVTTRVVIVSPTPVLTDTQKIRVSVNTLGSHRQNYVEENAWCDVNQLVFENNDNLALQGAQK
jgi:probable addiction module antidote protein